VSGLERARLFVSYQRYGALLVLGPIALVAGLATIAPWWLAAGLAALALWPLSFGVTVLGRWPKKLRATIVADRRIAAGRFRPASVRAYCGDPCFRLVAHEILRRAGAPRAERRRLVAGFRAELERERDTLFVVDHARGVVITVVDGRRTEQPLGVPQDAGPLVAP
jgi:hypothetical protein